MEIINILTVILIVIASQYTSGKKMGFIFADRDIPDSAFTAHSSWNDDHYPWRARIDKYYDWPCCWTSGTAQPMWIQVNLEKNAKAVGVVVRKRCDEPYRDQYITAYWLQVDIGNGWETVLNVKNMQYKYDFDRNDFQWFKKPVASKKWRLVVKAHTTEYASLKFDLIGK